MQSRFFRHAAIFLTAALLLTVLTACSHSDSTDTASSAVPAQASAAAESSEVPPADPLVGQWEAEMTEGAVYTFNADGTGQYLLKGIVMPLEYSTADGKITLRFIQEGYGPMVLDYSLDGNLLNIKDAFGNDNFYDRKTASEVQPD